MCRGSRCRGGATYCRLERCEIAIHMKQMVVSAQSLHHVGNTHSFGIFA